MLHVQMPQAEFLAQEQRHELSSCLRRMRKGKDPILFLAGTIIHVLRLAQPPLTHRHGTSHAHGAMPTAHSLFLQLADEM